MPRDIHSLLEFEKAVEFREYSGSLFFVNIFNWPTSKRSPSTRSSHRPPSPSAQGAQCSSPNVSPPPQPSSAHVLTAPLSIPTAASHPAGLPASLALQLVFPQDKPNHCKTQKTSSLAG